MGICLYVALATHIKEEDKHLISMRYWVNHALDITQKQVEITNEQGEVDQKTVSSWTLLDKAETCAKHLIQQGHEKLADIMLGAINGFYQKGTEERGSVLSTARRHTQFLDFGSMENVLTGHDFDMEDLKQDPEGVTVYLVLPATRMGTCNRWLRMMINQLFEAMERVKTLPTSPLLLALDEFPILGFMKQLQDAAGQFASFGVRIWVIMQDWGQGKALYKDRFESFAANAGILQAFGNTDITTTEYLSKKLGQTIVQETRTGDPAKTPAIQGTIGEQETRQLYPLMTADEITRFFSRSDEHKRQLIIWAGVHPMIMQRVEYYSENALLC